MDIALLPVQYVLSMGPVVWLYFRGYLSDETFQQFGVIYEPVAIALHTFPFCGRH